MSGMDIFFNRVPLVVNVELASILGLNESIILQQLHYWLEKNKKEGRNSKDGFTWTYNTYNDWQEQFPFWSDSTIRRIISKLENLNLLISANYNKEKFDRTKWYRIDYEELKNVVTARCGQNDLIDNIGVSEGESTIIQEETSPNRHCQTNNTRQALDIRPGQNEQIDGVKMTKSTCSFCSHPSGQNEQIDGVKMTRPIPETNNRDYPETTTTTKFPESQEPGCCCENLFSQVSLGEFKKVKEIFYNSGIHISSNQIISELAATYTLDELQTIATTLADRKKRGLITNPGGILTARPAAIARAILKGEFYPIATGSKNNKVVTTTSDYEIYVPPEQGG